MRPTASGLSLALVSALLTALGVRFGYPEAALAGLAGLTACGCALLWVLLRPRLELSRTVTPPHPTRGQRAHTTLELHNLGRRALHATVTDHADDLPLPIELPGVGPGTTGRIRCPLPLLRRGLLQLGPLTVDTRDPLGLARRSTHVGEAHTLLVRPRWSAITDPPAGSLRHPDGSTSDAQTGTSAAFHSLREFTDGDDLRRVHWPSTARTGELMVRRQADVSLPSLTLLLDTRPQSYPDSELFEAAVETTASLACSAARDDFPVRLHSTSGARLATRGDRRDEALLLDHLALVDLEDTGSLAEALSTLRREKSQGSLVIVTGRPSTVDDEQQIALARRHFDRITVLRPGGPA